MILDTMTLEELILEIKTDFKEVRGKMEQVLAEVQKNNSEKDPIPLVMGHDNQDP